MAKIAVVYTRDEINKNFAFPVVVESWERVMGSFSGKRKFREQFDEKERIRARLWYNKFYDWYLREGMPEQVTMFPESVLFVERLINFFGTV